MDRLERIFALHRLLSTASLPVPRRRIEEGLECSRATAKRVIDAMRLFLDAPIEYDRERNGYYYAPSQHKFELPGLWFKADELLALLTTQRLLHDLQPGLLDDHLAPLRTRIERILQAEHLGYSEAGHRIRILGMAARKSDDAHFATVATALLKRKQLWIEYHGRARPETTERYTSPQRLVHYRDNWYLDAWCHLRQALRSFALDRIGKARIENIDAKPISDEELDAHYAGAYGIFAGPPTHTAVLRFTAERARWVANEQWHPQQQGQFLPDGRYQLSLPYGDPRELIMDILKYGPDVEVMAPDDLRAAVVECLRVAYQRYRDARDGA
ncbi:MAG: helix-turn-helix transcriptional regulator [Gammaproteobacteria bacterium]